MKRNLDRVLAELLGRPVVGEPTAKDLRQAVVAAVELQALAESRSADCTRMLIQLDGDAMLDEGPEIEARIKAARADKRKAEGEVTRLAALVGGLRRRADEAEAAVRTEKSNATRSEIDRVCAQAMAAAAKVDQAVDESMKLISGLMVFIHGSRTSVGLKYLGDGQELGYMPQSSEHHLRELIALRATALCKGSHPLPSVAAAINDVCAVARRGHEAKQQKEAA